MHVGIPTGLAPRALAGLPCRGEALLSRPGGSRRSRCRPGDLLEDPALPRPELQAPEDRALQAPALARRTHAPEAGSRGRAGPAPRALRHPDRPGSLSSSAADDWSKARRAVERRAERHAAPRDGPAKLSAFARRFIRDGELDGRHSAKSRRSASPPSWPKSTSRAASTARLRPARRGGARQRAHPVGSASTPSRGALAHARRQREGGAHELKHASNPPPTCSTPGVMTFSAASRRRSTRSARRACPRLEIGPGLVTLIGGAPGQGKTALTMQLRARRPGRSRRACGRWYATSR